MTELIPSAAHLGKVQIGQLDGVLKISGEQIGFEGNGLLVFTACTAGKTFGQGCLCAQCFDTRAGCKQIAVFAGKVSS